MGVLLVVAIFFGVIFFSGGNAKNGGYLYILLAFVMIIGLYVVAGGQMPTLQFGVH